MSDPLGVLRPLCHRGEPGEPAACGARWMTTLWASDWEIVTCPACLRVRPEGADSTPDVQAASPASSSTTSRR